MAPLSISALNTLLDASSLLMVRAQMNPQSGSSITTFVPTEFGPGRIALPSLRLEYETTDSPAIVPEPIGATRCWGAGTNLVATRMR